MELNEAMLEFLESADDKEFTRYTFESMIDQPEVRALLKLKGYSIIYMKKPKILV